MAPVPVIPSQDSIERASELDLSGAFGGIRTPNLLIRRPISGVREGIRRLPLMASELG